MIHHSKPTLGEEEKRIASKVIESGMIAGGTYVKLLEDMMTDLTQNTFSKATSSGTTAIQLALRSMNINKTDEVIIPDYVCFSVLSAVEAAGATPVLADISKDGPNLTKKSIEEKITPKTKAIVLPHLLGIVAEYDPISELGIPVIEDCAQAIGARYDDSSYVGSKGMISIYSYYPTKMMAASKGGMIQTNDKDAYLKLCDLMRYDGRDKHGEAYNLSMNNIEASIGTEQLKKLPDFIEMRKDIANRYNEEFQSLSKAVPLEIKGNSIPYRYILILEGDIDIDEIITQFHNENIDVRKPVFRPLHMYFSNTNSFQHSTNAQNKYLSIPIYPSLTTEEQIFIIDKTTKILGDKA